MPAELPNRLPWIEYWYLAFAADIGIKITCTNFISLSTLLYKARDESMDEDLNILRVLKSPLNPDGELWIIKSEYIPEGVAARGRPRKSIVEDLNDI